MRQLSTNSWVEGEKLSQKAFDVLNEIEAYFKTQKKKTDVIILGDSFNENIQRYLEMFPNKKLPSGKQARVAPANLVEHFRWFFTKFNYDWKTVLKATANYVDEYEAKNYEFMRNSQYFVKKQDKDKSVISDLADYCNAVDTGQEPDKEYFSEKAT